MPHISFNFRELNSAVDIFRAGIEYFKQAKQQSIHEGKCCYRSANDTHCCVVGAFMPDSEPIAKYEANDVARLVHRFKDHPKEFTESDPAFRDWAYRWWRVLFGLQRVHDTRAHWDLNGFQSWGWAELQRQVEYLYDLGLVSAEESALLITEVKRAADERALAQVSPNLDKYFG